MGTKYTLTLVLNPSYATDMNNMNFKFEAPIADTLSTTTLRSHESKIHNLSGNKQSHELHSNFLRHIGRPKKWTVLIVDKLVSFIQ